MFPSRRDSGESSGGFYPALLAFNLNSLIMEIWPGVLERLLSESILAAPFMIRYSFGSVVLMAGTIGLSMAVFSPAYYLLDGGVMYSTESRAEGSGRPGEVRTVGVGSTTISGGMRG